VTRIPVVEDKSPIKLAGISKNYIYLKEYEEREGLTTRGYQYYDLIRKYKVERSADVDDLFNVDSVEEIFKRKHTGVEYGTPYGRWRRKEGSRLKALDQYLGDPDYAMPVEVSGSFDFYYEKENLHVVGHTSAVYFIEEVRPDWAKFPKFKYRGRKR